MRAALTLAGAIALSTVGAIPQFLTKTEVVLREIPVVLFEQMRLRFAQPLLSSKLGSTFLDVKLCQGVRHTQQVRGLLESQLTNTRPEAAAV